MKKILGFSLVELMISLIVISVVTAAFAPIITKKLKTSDMSIGSAGSDYIFDESICSSSVANCSICVKDECVRCKIGYYLDNDTCKPCSDNCTTCDSQKGCIKCASGYYLDGTICKSCPVGCKSCENASSCETCEDKYIKQDSNCKACPNHCANCSSSTTCTKCEDSYFLTSDNLCFKYQCSGQLCYLADNNDKVLTVYRYSLGSFAGIIQIPSGVTTCYLGSTCSCTKDSAGVCTSATCWRANDTTGINMADYGRCGISSKSSFSGCNRVICNRMGAQVAVNTYKSSGLRLPNSSDLDLIRKIKWEDPNVQIADPFCTYMNSSVVPQCFSRGGTRAWGLNYSYTDPHKFWIDPFSNPVLQSSSVDLPSYLGVIGQSTPPGLEGQIYFVK